MKSCVFCFIWGVPPVIIQCYLLICHPILGGSTYNMIIGVPNFEKQPMLKSPAPCRVLKSLEAQEWWCCSALGLPFMAVHNGPPTRCTRRNCHQQIRGGVWWIYNEFAKCDFSLQKVGHTASTFPFRSDDMEVTAVCTRISPVFFITAPVFKEIKSEELIFGGRLHPPRVIKS